MTRKPKAELTGTLFISAGFIVKEKAPFSVFLKVPVIRLLGSRVG
jgi:hypothetical protein